MEQLAELAGEAPSPRFAREYERVQAELQRELLDLDAPPSPAPSTPPQHGNTIRSYSPGSTGNKPPFLGVTTEVPSPADSRTRVFLIVAIGICVVALLGYLALRRDAGRGEEPIPVAAAPVVVEEAATATAVSAPAAPDDATQSSSGLSVTAEPGARDFGEVRKGTRAARDFTLSNKSVAPVKISLSRSACRCLYYEYPASLAPGKSAVVRVIIDGMKAKKGPLRESIKVSAGNEALASLTVAAEVR